MAAPYYRPLLVVAASLSLLIAGCGGRARNEAAPGDPTRVAANTQPPVSTGPSEMETEATIFTVLGMAKRPSQRAKTGPQIGEDVSPSLWTAAHDTLNFVPIASEDPIGGIIVTDWYSPPKKPNERLKISVFILSYALRSDSLAVAIERETKSPIGNWTSASVARQLVDDMENAILLRAREIHAETYRATVLAK